MRKYLFILMAALLLVGCGGKEDEKTTDELKEDVKEAEEELQDGYKNMNEESSLDEDSEESISSESETEEVSEETEDDDVSSEDNTNDIEWDVESIVGSDLDNTTITDLRVNEDASVDEERYIVLVDLEWDVKNGAKTTKEMLDMYSDHLAAKLADDDMIHELVLFWTVPYHNENESILKRTYENKEDGMFLEDEMKDVNVFD